MRRKVPKANTQGEVQLSKLKPYYKNPRIGNVEKIRESIAAHGQIKTVCVNIGTHTGRPYEILAGSHTVKAMKLEGMKVAQATLVDVDEEEAKKIVLVDNGSSDGSRYDDRALADLLASLTSPEGSGFAAAEIDAIVTSAEEDASRVLVGIEEEEAERERSESKSRKKKDAVPTEDGASADIPEQSETLPGVDELKPALADTQAFRVGQWGTPALRDDVLVEPGDVPENLKAWAGSATREHDTDQWWLYNWRIDSTSGMKDISKVIVAFYAFDKYFELWYDEPAKYVAKLLNSGIDMMLTPNYSMYSEQSMTLNLYALYRARYVGRYAQEAGIYLIPDINWAPGVPMLLDIVLETLPDRVPVFSIQIQTVGVAKSEDDTAFIETFYSDVSRILTEMVENHGAEMVIVYGKPEGFDLFHKYVDIDADVKSRLEVREIPSRLVALGAMHAKRKRKNHI